MLRPLGLSSLLARSSVEIYATPDQHDPRLHVSSDLLVFRLCRVRTGSATGRTVVVSRMGRTATCTSGARTVTVTVTGPSRTFGAAMQAQHLRATPRLGRQPRRFNSRMRLAVRGPRASDLRTIFSAFLPHPLGSETTGGQRAARQTVGKMFASPSSSVCSAPMAKWSAWSANEGVGHS